jgi:hypothetical protein
MTKTCTVCHKTLPLSFFYKERHGIGGVKGKCKPCYEVVKKAYKDKSRRMGICITCAKPAIPGRANCVKHNQAVLEQRQMQMQKRRDEDRCVTCGIPLHYQMDKGFRSCLNCREYNKGAI